MKKTLAILLLALTAVFPAEVKASDPVVMRVGGTDVRRSEFDYFRRKSAGTETTDPAAFATMFGRYKQRVLAARAAGLDTAAAFRREMERYRRELSGADRLDSAFVSRLAAEGARLRGEEHEMNYILMPVSTTRSEADSLREAIASGRTSFDEAARRHSADPVVASYGGRMGWSALGMMPRDVEEMIAAVEPGKLSDVLTTSQGLMIVEGGRRRPLGGDIDAGIIVLAHDGTPDGKERARALADSISAVLRQSPQSLPRLAALHSADLASGKRGGRIGAIHAGEALPEIYETLRELPDHGVSDPVALGQNYMVLVRLGSSTAPSLAQLEADEARRIKGGMDYRYQVAADHRRDYLRKLLKARFAPAYREVIGRMESQGLDSTLMAEYGDKTMVSTAAGSASLRDLAPRLANAKSPAGSTSRQILSNEIEAGERRFLESLAPDFIIASDPTLTALMREYEEGSLMYEANNAKVWHRASESPEELEAFFEDNRADYRWRRPRIYAKILSAADSHILRHLTDTAMLRGLEAAAAEIKSTYQGKAKLESVLVAPGENAVVDALMQGRTPTAAPGSLRFFALLDSRLVAQPENATQAGPSLLRDYQNYLEEQWQHDLDAAYPIEILRLPKK